jgi:3-hydroxypropanoate dehydrogenase
MSAQVLRLRPQSCSAAAPVARELLDQLHGLLKLDPIAGVSPARALFVVSDDAKARLARHLGPADADQAVRAPALAVIGYDFPFAVSLLLAAKGGGDCAAAIRVARRSAALQGESLRLAARAVGLEAQPIANFDAAGLRAEFFSGSEGTVVSLCTLTPEASLMAASAFEGLDYHTD